MTEQQPSTGSGAGTARSHAVAIGLFGNFNPMIFRPQWFSRNGLVEVGEAKGAIPLAEGAGLVSFEFDWMQLEVSPDRLLVYSDDEKSFQRVYGLVVGTFRELRHTPIYGVAVSRERHEQFATEAAVESALDRYLPAAPWHGALPRIEERRLEIDGPRDDDLEGRVRIEVSKSIVLDNAVYIGVIDDVDVYDDIDDVEGSDRALEVLGKMWSRSAERADMIWRRVAGGVA